ncbi:MAG: SAM-dependent DNA methyltransferase [Bacteroidales bacterium]|nr:SAM-dependent DNA methyltransferase [Bacteroidales bacterium]
MVSTEIMMDDNSLDVSKEVALVFSIANSLRGTYTPDKYKEVIIPMTVIRRFECALENTKDKVIDTYKKNPKTPAAILEKVSGYKFYNVSQFNLSKLLNDPNNLKENLKNYINGFSKNVKSIIDSLEFEKEIIKMDKNNRLYGVIKKFSELDLNPNTIDGMKMGYMFEEIIRKFSENADAGDHYTPREVIRLLVNILLAEGSNDLYEPGKVVTVLDMACGSGGMLSSTYDAIKRQNLSAEIRLYGQEINPESYAICLADMLIKGQDTENIRFQDTMKADAFSKEDMRIVIANPPFGTPWGGKDAADGVEDAVIKESKNYISRFPAGLPAKSDMQLLFMQHALYKMDKKDGRAAIICNGSPLFTGNTTSGESQIRKYMLENDLIEAIIALPTDLFYNTGIGIYAFIFSNNKEPRRKGKVQLIDATSIFHPLRKPLGKKRKELSREDIRKITEIYADFKENKHCKIFDNEDFMYKEYAVYEPLQRTGKIDFSTIDKLASSSLFTNNANIYKESEYQELKEVNPRSAPEEKKFKKFEKGIKFTGEVISILKENTESTIYKDFKKFKSKLKKLIGKVDGMTPARLESIAFEMSEIDKTAVVQKDSRGNIIPDKTTKDTEIIKYNEKVQDYFEREVYPYVPDALYYYEYDPNKKNSIEPIGAEFQFTKYFYEYSEPEKSEELLQEFIEIEKELTEDLQELLGGELNAQDER